MAFAESNGILPKVGGEFIAAGSQRLPAPGPGLAEQNVEVDTGDRGRVRITYRASRARHHKHSHWFWTAVYAESAQPATSDDHS